LRSPETLAEVLQLIEADLDLSPTRRRDLASALRAIGKIAHQDLAAMPASFAHLRTLTAPHTAVALGLSAKRWANVRAELAFALRRVGIAPRQRRLAVHLPEPWWSLRAGVRDVAIQRGLARFLAYCADHTIAPEAVDEGTFQGFLVWLEAGTLVPKPLALHRCAIVQWNRATAQVPGWPQRKIVVPCRTNHVRLPLQTFPASFHADVEAWQACLAGSDLLQENGPAKPLRPASLRHMRYQVLMVASAWVRAGCDPAELCRLADLVEPERFRSAMRFLIERHGGKPNRTLDQLATTFVHLARHWVKLDPERLKSLIEIRKRLSHKVQGLSAKNRSRLRQFDEPLNQLALLELPERLLGLAERQPKPLKAAYLVQTALIILLLQMAPIRLRNLQTLHCERHFHRLPGRRRQGRVRLVIPGEETKNGEPLDFPLPPELVRILDLYLERHRPQLVASEADQGWLFPGRGGGLKHAVSLGVQISGAVRRHTGLLVHPHLFRHLAAKLALQEAPGNYEQARRLLGHKSIDTTTLYYTGFNGAEAAAVYQAQLLERRLRLKGQGRGHARG
jgi:integrase